MEQDFAQKVHGLDFFVQDAVQTIANRELQVVLFGDFMNELARHGTFRQIADFANAGDEVIKILEPVQNVRFDDVLPKAAVAPVF